MNRFHVHLHVADLDANIGFYSRLFGAGPSVRKPDYAKWMLDDPRINFAISTPRDGSAIGLSHLGLQAETEGELAAIGARLAAADAIALAETGTTCCYARSDKFWAVDPQGLHWESFRSFGEATTYFAPPGGVAVDAAVCCAPATLDGETSQRGVCGTSCATQPERQVVAPNASACCA